MRTLKISLNGTGFAGSFTAEVYREIPHKNEVNIELAGVCAGRLENAKGFAARYGVKEAFAEHAQMLAAIEPDIDNIACANHVHGQYTMEAARAGVQVIVLEKPPVLWPGHSEERTADAETRKIEAMVYLAKVLDEVDLSGSKLLYAENFNYVDGVRGIAEVLREGVKKGKGKILYQWGACAHQGSASPVYDTPAKSGGGSLFNKACHPLGPVLYLKQVEGILRDGRPIRPEKISAVALRMLKDKQKNAGDHFRVMENVDDFGRITVIFQDGTIAEVTGYDLCISGIRNELSVIADNMTYEVRINPNNSNEIFLPDGSYAGDLLFREKLPTAEGTSFPSPNERASHGYVNEMDDAVECALRVDRYPQSGPMMAWDTMAVLMAAYESDEKESRFIDVSEYINGRNFRPETWPDPPKLKPVFNRQ